MRELQRIQSGGALEYLAVELLKLAQRIGARQDDPDDVPSPSFTLINEYDLRLKAYHIDLYRLETREDLRSLDLEEIFAQPAVILVEWAEKLGNPDLPGVVKVKIEDCGDDERRIEIGPAKPI